MPDETLAGVRADRDRLAAENTALREALAELVSLKDGPRDDRYRARKDWAWSNARAALAGPPRSSTPSLDREPIADLIERSSLGTPAAKAARARTDPERARAIVDEVNRRSAAAAAGAPPEGPPPTDSARWQAIELVAAELAEAISEFVTVRGSDHGWEADQREAARCAVDALLSTPAVLAALRPPVSPDGDHPTPVEDEWGDREEWAVFCGHPDEGDLVETFDELAEAEELAQRVIDAHIAHRWSSTTVTAWEVRERCGGCGSALDGALCCDVRRAEIEAGEAVLRDA